MQRDSTMPGSGPRRPRVGDKYAYLEGALKQAMEDNEVAAERRQEDLKSFQSMVAEGDSLRTILAVLLVMAGICALMYFPRMFDGDHTYTGLVSIFFGFIGIGLVYELVRQRKKARRDRK